MSDKRSLAIAYSMKRKGKKCASGGSVDSGDAEMNFAKGGEVDPSKEVTCPHCEKTFSHGGEVANDVGQGDAADKLPNEFDDLVLDDSLEEHYTGNNSGDEIGNKGEDKRRDDVVMRAMAKRRAKKRD